MRKKVTISVAYNEYGIPDLTDKQKEARVTFRLGNKNEVEIYANKEGLRLMAKTFLGLAEYEREDGYHIHLDDMFNINDEGKSFILYKEEEKE